MERREFLTGAATAALTAWLPAQAFAAAGAAPGDAAFAALADRLFYNNLLLTPNHATGLGLDTGVRAALRSRLDDKSEAGRAATQAFDRAGLAAMRGVDSASLSPAVQRQRDILAYMFERRLAGVPFGIESVQQPYPITQQQGIYFEVPDMLDSQHPVETAADAEAYLARLRAFAFALDEDTLGQKRLAGRGVIAPRWSLDLALGQLAKLRSAAPEASSLVLSLSRRTTSKAIPGDWAAQAAKIVGGDVYPALDRQIALIKALRLKTPAGDGAWRVRGGDAIYAAALAEATTTRLSPEEVHKIGLAQVADITGKLDAILRGAGYTKGTVGERLTALNHAPDQLYPDSDAGRADLIASLNAGIATMAKKLPQAFANYPSEPLEIRRVPVEIQDGASNGYYYSASLDGSRPAIYWINLKSVGDWPRYSLPSLTYHEGIPGHHLQGGYAQKGGALPLYLKDYFLSAHGEGWALYAEQLADELGGYSALERAGYLQSFLFRAARLVVDTGIHHYRWSREKATAYMVATTGFAQARSQREVERYCVLIGQACSYKIGHTAWVAARTKAQAALGDKFSLPWFHGILEEGTMPLFMLEKRIEERTAERLAAG
ncbi:DUF885 domain-containing protein [Novosphingobium sp.]|uniref:DUF885 domain-containing protein n=1 Tax=Novosphingobium sp. TaxID=1874826 RepID=UPI003BAA2955